MFFDDVYTRAMSQPGQQITLTLGEGDTAEIPGTTERVMLGPGTVTYQAHADGMLEITGSTCGWALVGPGGPIPVYM